VRHQLVKSISRGIFVLGIVALPLAGCTMANFGGSAFGGNKMQIAQLPDTGNYNTDSALTKARDHFRSNEFGYSAAYYKKVVELSPKNPEGYVGLGASYDRLGRYDLSDRVYASLHKLSGGTAQYYNNVGYSHMLRGNLTSALKNFRKAERLEPDNLVVANNLQLLADIADTRA